MALKVVSSYNPGTLKVVNNYGSQTATYNPQQTAPSPQQTYNPQPATYNPQRTASASRLQQTAAEISAQQARAFQAEQDRIIAERAATKRRLIDAKNVELGQRKAGFLGLLGDKASFGDLRRQRGGRELAVKYWKQNEDEWGGQLMARQRNYENKGAQLKDWVMQSNNETEYNQRVAQANEWLDREYKAITADIADFTNTQKELASYSETPLKGKFAQAGRITKGVVGNVVSKSWNALTWTTAQPQRVVNTAINFVNPNRLRQYYGGEEKNGLKPGQGSNAFKASLDQLKTSYNASKSQRLVGFSKADEKRIITPKTGFIPIKQKDGTIKWRKTTYTPNALNKFRGKYGDDIVDMMLDPMSWLSGAGNASKVGKASVGDRLLELAGKNKLTRNLALSTAGASSLLKESKIGRTFGKLGHEWKPRATVARDQLESLSDELNKTVKEFQRTKSSIYNRFGKEIKVGNQAKSDFLVKQTAHQQRLMADTDKFRAKAEKLSQDYIKRLEQFSDREVRAITRYGRNGSWSATDKISLSKYKRADLEKFLSDYQIKARELAKSEGLNRRANNYLPEFSGRGYDPTAKRTVFGQRYSGQSRQQLQESIIMRDFVSNWDESNSYMKQLASTEKSILRNAKRTNRALTEHEKDQLKVIADRKATIERTTKKFETKFDAIRGAMADTRKRAQPALRFSRSGVQTNLSKRGFANTASDVYHAPMKLWKKSVLKYNPAWYVNNTMWNIPASISAGGPQVFGEYRKLLTSRKYWNEVTKNLPEGVMSKISQDIGKGGLASKIEDTSRVATFLTLRKKGFADDKALNMTNRWLFDYATKNWERPIKGVLPFWNWQKNLIRLGGTMPFHNPRSAKVYTEGYNKFYQRPYENLPDEVQTYTDPETGKEVSYNPRQAYKGKAKIGDKFYGLPFFATNPETMLQFGVNPYLSAGADYVTSTDRFGRKNTDRSGASILGERFPQANLYRNFKKRNDQITERYFAKSGNSKEKQGYDPRQPNYDKSLDQKIPFQNNVKSFLGIPRGVKFDKQEFDTKKRLSDFNKAFFAVDWDKEEEAGYKQAQAKKEAMAKKFGFDLKKDIYDNYWSKYDTATTRNTKRLKEEASKFNSPDSGYWHDYFALEAGSRTSASKRRPYLIGKFDEWKRDHTFAQNPYFNLPGHGSKSGKGEINPFTLKRQESDSQARRSAGKRKYEAKLAYERKDWAWFARNGYKSKRTPITADGKYFKTVESRDKYLAGKAKYATSQLWQEYYSLPNLDAKKAFLAKHPELKAFEQPKTQAEWDAVRALIRQKRKDKLNSRAGFTAIKDRNIATTNLKVMPSAGRKLAIRFK